MKYILAILLIFWFYDNAKSQGGPFLPAIGAASNGIHKDSIIFKSWGNAVSVVRGFQQWNIGADTATVGRWMNGTGAPLSNGFLSLGDGGEATVYFAGTIYNGPGADFAVFSNAFQIGNKSDSLFIELALVEVSSDGEHFFRFPAVSLTQSERQIGGFEGLNPRKLHHFAGKHPSGFGTPFDLDSLPNNPLLNKDSIRYIKIIDIIGDINHPNPATDSKGNIINSPWPTPFPSSGFDLDCVGAINYNIPLTVFGNTNGANNFSCFPNPSDGFLYLVKPENKQVKVFDLQGRILFMGKSNQLQLNDFLSDRGCYMIQMEGNSKVLKFIYH